MYNITGRRRAYCGPSALSAITGITIEEAERKLRRHRTSRETKAIRKRKPDWRGKVRGGRVYDINGRRIPIRSTHDHEMLAVLASCGFKAVGYGASSKLTLGQFCHDRGHMGIYLVNVTGHWVVIDRGYLADSFFRDPIRWDSYYRLKRRVRQWWRFDPARTGAMGLDVSPDLLVVRDTVDAAIALT